MIILGLTLYQFITIAIILIALCFFTVFFMYGACLDKHLPKVLLIEIFAFFLIYAFVAYLNANTASGARRMKDAKSERDNGIERVIIVQDEDGKEVYHYEGKVDIESDHTDNYIKFEDENGKRQIIYYGITDRVFVKEK